MVYVLQLNNKKQIETVTKFYEDKTIDNDLDYISFVAKLDDTTITLFKNNKLMFQGKGADKECNIWKNLFNLKEINKDKKKNKKETTNLRAISAIGSDEVGTGDYFGPIVVTSALVENKDIHALLNLNVKDSKMLSDIEIINLAPNLIEKLEHVTTIIYPEEINKHSDINQVELKIIMHNKAIVELEKKVKGRYKVVIVDKFTTSKKHFSYLNKLEEQGFEVEKDLTLITKAESAHLAVAAASIISRYKYLEIMDKLSKKLGATVPTGAGSNVDKFAIELLKDIDPSKRDDLLKKIAKYNFKNTDKIYDYFNMNGQL